MKRIVIDGFFLMEKHPVGLHRFSTEILREWSKKHSCKDIIIAVPDNPRMNIDLSSYNVCKVSSWVYRIPKIGKLLWTNFVYPKFVKKNKAMSIDLAYAQQVRKCDVVGVFDCIPYKFPENYSGFRDSLSRWKSIFLIRKSAQKSKIVVTLSRDAMKDVLKYTHIPADKIKIIPCGWEHINRIKFDDTIFERLPEGFHRGNYFFSLGSRYRHKNMKWVFEAAIHNPEQYFIITGTKFSHTDDMIEGLPNVYFTGYLTDQEIKSLIKYARALIQPSIYEGFGIPPMEALAIGTQVIVSGTSSLGEVYRGYAHLIDPSNYENLNLEVILRQPVNNAEELLEKYTWAKAAEKYWNIINSF